MLNRVETLDVERSAIDRFREVVRAQPDAVAVSAAGATLTYEELDRRSNAIANRILAEVGPGPEPVMVLLPPDERAASSVVGVFKSGRPCLPTHHAVPRARVVEVEAFAKPAMVLDERSAGGSGDESDPGVVTRPDDPATLLFTSGSTGHPKGVLAPQRMWTHGVWATAAALELRPTERIGALSPLSSHLGMSTMWCALLDGCELHPIDVQSQPISSIPSWVDAHELDVMFLTPSVMRAFVATMDAGHAFDRLRAVLTAGEATLGRDVEAARVHVGPDAAFVSRAGASETGVLSFYTVAPGDDAPAGAVPFGRPVEGLHARVVANDGTETQVGERGELVVAARHLALGYWNDPELTAARFAVDGSGRLTYRTGDLVRRREDGCLEHLGRLDAMVKIRGNVVEPTEIESKLVATGAVREAAVVARSTGPGDVRLVAYVVPEATAWPSGASLRRTLASQVPGYMVPQTIVQLTDLPRNANGKVDRVALSESRIDEERTRRIPVTEWQLFVVYAWRDVLGVDEVYLDDDFFELGGDSLAVEEMLAELGDRIGMHLETAVMLERPTCDELAERIAHPLQPGRSVLVQVQAGGDRPPLICVAGAGCFALAFLPLARRLGGGLPVFGLQPHGLEYRAVPDWTIAAAARRYVRAVRTVQPHGPYQLVGYSGGGVIAFEMARRLEAAGEEVAFLGLLDAVAPRRGAGRAPAPVAAVVPAVVPAAVPGETRAALGLRGRVRRVKRRAGLGARVLTTGVVPRSGAAQCALFYDQLRVVLRRYRPSGTWAGSAVIVRAGRTVAAGRDDAAWFDYLLGPAETHDVDGDHISFLHDPYVEAVAASLSPHLLGAVRTNVSG